MRTQVHFIQNVLAFQSKRKDVLLKTPLRFSSSVKEFFSEYKLRIFQWFSPHRNSQKATAEAAATLSESTPCAMGIRTT